MVKSMSGLSGIFFYGTLSILISACGSDNGAVSNGDKAVSVPIETYQWKMVTVWPANFPVFQEGVEKFASDVRVMSNGRLDIKVYAAGELVPALQVFDAVSQGVVEMGHGSPYYWAGKVPEAQFFSSVPLRHDNQGDERLAALWRWYGTLAR